MKPKRKQGESTVKQTIHDKHDNTIIGECQALVLEFGESTVEDFKRHWLEKDRKGVSKWMKQETWDTKLRLITWKKNEGKWGGKKKQTANGQNNVVL